MRAHVHRSSVRRRLAAAWQTYGWYLVGVLTAGTLALAYIGIDEYCRAALSAAAGAPAAAAQPPCNVPLRWWDILYLSLQLFIWQSGGLFVGAQVNPALQFARFAAPVLVGYAAIRGLLVLFADEYQTVRARFNRKHVVICGLGSRGLTLAARVRAAGWRVVMVESNDHPGAVRPARAHGAVIVGDAADPHILRKAGVRRAEHVVSLCGSDAMNAEVAAQAMALVAGRRRVLTCHAHVADPVLWESLRMRELASPRGGGGRIQFFNTFDVAARAMAAAVLPRFTSSPDGRHLLLIGLGPVSERFIVYLGRTWPFTRERSDERIRITVADSLASDKVHALTRRYPRLGDACELVPRDIDRVDLGPLLSAGGPRVTAACVTSSDDAAALTTGLALVHRSRDDSFPVVICVSQERGLDVLLGTGDGADSRITLLGMLERGCTPELVLQGSNEILARAIHDEYLRDQLRAGHSFHTNPAMQPWEALAGSLRDSNRRQADHIREKLESIGCAIAPSAEWDATLLRFTGAEVEQMARMEHQRWVNERKDESWRHDPGPKNIERKTSPYLVDWELLPDTVKEFDRNTVRNMPAFLARVGLCVYRLPRAHAEETA